MTIALPHDVPDQLMTCFLTLPHGEPFTTARALQCGVTFAQLRGLVAVGLLVHPMRGVYVSINREDDLSLRIRCLKLVVPPDCVVTDRTAGWLWGADMILAPNDHLTTPRVSVFCPPGYRLRNGLVRSGERMLSQRDVVELDGLRVTTPLRTACDLGRLLHRDQAFAALDAMAALKRFSLDELAAAEPRFKGYRGVLQLRAFVSLVDPRSQSPGESILRLRWYDTGLPRPECQVEVPTPWGASYFIDMGLPELRYGGEYDGDAFHGPEQAEHDSGRRIWLTGPGDWIIDVARAHNVHGQRQDIHAILRRGYESARRRAQNVDPPERF